MVSVDRVIPLALTEALSAYTTADSMDKVGGWVQFPECLLYLGAFEANVYPPSLDSCDSKLRFRFP